MMISYTNIINHTSQNAEDFYELLKHKKIHNKLEDVAKEFFKTFNDEWLNK